MCLFDIMLTDYFYYQSQSVTRQYTGNKGKIYELLINIENLVEYGFKHSYSPNPTIVHV